MRPETCSAKISRPDGVVRSLEISGNAVEPLEPIVACNLLPKDDARATELEEPEPRRPEVPLVVVPARSLPDVRGAPWLTGTGAGPHGPIVGPSGEPERVRPSSDPGEEMTLNKPGELAGVDVDDRSRVDFPISDRPCLDQCAQPFGRLLIVFVVVGSRPRAHRHRPFLARASSRSALRRCAGVRSDP